ncbi:hypothetical protein TWF506_010206 [Arthrobotrys conoides]|uniref:Uncharacterized protein n=1 Tax=Arthrobotrys conoides TaxID=74498 RepID=A0AAN8NR07_9PEZI
MAPLVEAISNTNTDGTANNAISPLSTPSRNIKDHDIHPQYSSERSKENAPSAKSVIPCSPSRSPGFVHRTPAQEKPIISLITAIPPSISNISSSTLTTPSTAASSSMTVGLISGGPNPTSTAIMDEKQPKLPNISSAVGEQLNASNGHLPSLAPSSAHGGSTFPSFHHHHHHHHHRPSSFLQPGGGQQSQPVNSPFPSPDAMSSRREEFLPRPFSYTTPTALQHSPSMPFSEGSELDEDGRSRKRYGRPPGAKDKRPRRRRTKAQMEEDALIYGYRDSESVYHSPSSLKRRRLSPRRDSLEDSPQEDNNSPPPQPVYTYPAFNPFPGPQPASHQSPTANFNPFLHRHHLPASSGNPAPSLPALRNNSDLSSSRHGSDPVWPSRATEPDRIPNGQIPDSRPGAGDFGPSRYPPSPVGPTGFSSINASRSSENLRQPPSFHGERSEPRSRDLAPRHSPIPQEQGREPVIKWEHPSSSQNTLPRLGELPRLTDFQLDRQRWDRPDDLSRKQDIDRRTGPHENQLPSIPPLHASHILNPPPHTEINTTQRGPGSPGSSRPQFPDILRTAPEPLAAGGDRLLVREGRAGSITNISVGPPLEAETPKRDEEDTDEQIEEYRARMLEKHSSYYNGALGKPRVKREPSYAMPGKSPLQEENERLRAAIQRYRQQKGIERLKLEEFINKRCNGDQGMIKELLTITGHIAEDDYVGPVKPACL